MTKNDFFQLMASAGISPALQKLPAKEPEIQLLLGRIERLEKSLKSGQFTTQGAYIERNRIAYALMHWLKDGPPEESPEHGESLKEISNQLRDLFGISAEEEAAALEAGAESQRLAEESRAKYLQSLPEDDLSPLPQGTLSGKNEIRQLVAQSELALALRHLLAHTEGTSRHGEAAKLAEMFKALRFNEKTGLIAPEALSMQYHQIAGEILSLLDGPESDPEIKGKSWWRRLWG
ncbi:MAG: hypothetical protein J5I98_04790 [Phaeodactylibacter sp.]|nr:hypothetical protein [Phaeodactylibacter sp.]